VIPYGRQSVDDDDVAAVVNVLRGDWLTQGPHIEEFEAALREVTEARHVVAFSNGTAALHGAMAAANIGPGDLVATPSLTFAASANCARYVGADVTFVDIDPKTWNIDLAAIPPCDAVVAVHYAGLPVELSALKSRPRVVIEDAAHALGASTPDGPVGNCASSDMCMFSFHPVKAVTTGEGGAITTNSDDLAEALRAFRSHGVRRPEGLAPWEYEIATLGYNYRLTDIAAALGTSQLRKLCQFIDRRQHLAARYKDRLAHLPIGLPPDGGPSVHHARHLFPVLVPDRRRVYEEMRAAGIGVQVHYVPVHRQPIYAKVAATLPETDRIYDTVLSLPLYPALSEVEQDHVVATLESVL
jgi:perosamine synthetase